MKHNVKLWGILFCMLTPLLFAACSDDKDEPATPPAANLVVSPANLSLLSDKGATVTFSVKCGSTWSLTGVPEWLNLSATSGNGDSDITVTALSANNDDVARSATIEVSAGSESAEITISQLPALASECTVGISDILPLTTSVAYKYDIQPGVSYFYAGYLDKASAGWTDEKIVQTLTDEESFDPLSNEATGLQGIGGLYSDTEYYLCTVAFNDKGERGKLVKTRFKTQKYNNATPYVIVDEVKYSATKWYWNTSMNAYTSKYYMMGFDGPMAFAINLLYTEAEIAWLIKSQVESGNITAIANSSSWNMDRSSGADDVLISTWGVNIDGNYSPRLYTFYSSLTSSDSKRKVLFNTPRTSSQKRSCIPTDRLKELLSSFKTYNRR